MKVLGIDYGKKRIGLAISDPSGTFALDYRAIQAASVTEAAAQIKDIVEQEKITELVLGLPKRLDNTLGQSANAVNEFAQQLSQAGVDVSITFWDERLSSKQAEVMLRDTGIGRREKRVHTNVVAAQLILQNFLDSRNTAKDVNTNKP
ncbi:MAG: Holliday junction resolvase RuvX [Candidatus Brocadiia bacterium]